MKFFKWKTDYETGISEIDNQHRKLIEYLNELYDSTLEGDGNQTVKQILNKLFDYVSEHFRTEEELMKAAGYQDLESHKAEHHKFEAQIQEFSDNLENGFTISFQLINMLKTWLAGHIMGSDREYIPSVKKLGEKKIKHT